MRKLVAESPEIIGQNHSDPTKNTWGNTPFLHSATECLKEMADVIISDEDPVFQVFVTKFRGADPTHQEMSLKAIKQQRLGAKLKAWLGLSSNDIKSLGLTEAQLEQCVATSDPVRFDVKAEKSYLRCAALRVLCAKPSSTAVERLWSHFRDTSTNKRCSMLSSTLSSTVFTKMNMHLLPQEKLDKEQRNAETGMHYAVPTNYD